MGRPIAVLSSNLTQSIEWLRSRYEINYISKRWCKDINGNEYFIVSKREHIMAFEFSDYIKAPDFKTLEDLVKTRIR